MGQKNQSNKPIGGLVLELRPDDNQKVLLSKHLNGCRFIIDLGLLRFFLNNIKYFIW